MTTFCQAAFFFPLGAPGREMLAELPPVKRMTGIGFAGWFCEFYQSAFRREQLTPPALETNLLRSITWQIGHRVNGGRTWNLPPFFKSRI